jgi:acyl-CoA thioesterase FadM
LHDRWVQTAKLSVRFVKPAPLGKRLKATGELTRDAKRLMEMRGELIDVETNEVLATAEGTFVRVPDAMRDELARRLGGDFSAWEEWLSAARASRTVAR